MGHTADPRDNRTATGDSPPEPATTRMLPAQQRHMDGVDGHNITAGCLHTPVTLA